MSGSLEQRLRRRICLLRKPQATFTKPRSTSSQTWCLGKGSMNNALQTWDTRAERMMKDRHRTCLAGFVFFFVFFWHEVVDSILSGCFRSCRRFGDKVHVACQVYLSVKMKGRQYDKPSCPAQKHWRDMLVRDTMDIPAHLKFRQQKMREAFLRRIV